MANDAEYAFPTIGSRRRRMAWDRIYGEWITDNVGAVGADGLPPCDYRFFAAGLFVCLRRRHPLLSARGALGSPWKKVSDGHPPSGKTTPAPSKAARIAASLPGFGLLRPFSKSLIVGSLRLALAASRTRDQFNRARAVRDCSAESKISIKIRTFREPKMFP